MTKILVVSDSHRDHEILTELVDRFEDQVDLMIHTGDSELEADNPLTKKFLLVTGNMDYGTNFPEALTLETADDEVIYVTHGHLVDVNFGLTQLFLKGKEAHANMIFYGHTHQLMATMEDGILILNPGSISFPRGKYTKIGGTFAIVDSQPDKYEVQYYNREFKPISDLKFVFDK